MVMRSEIRYIEVMIMSFTEDIFKKTGKGLDFNGNK